jgi:pyruvate/2-oxoglutarate dehydrogenase complex dihydrolipoamide acyltransferase (E2) component
VRHGRDDKIVVYKMKRRKGYRKKQGHRQGFTEVRVLDIEIGGGATTGRKASKKKADAPVTPAAEPPAEAPVAEVAAEAPEAPAKIEATDTARALAEEHDIDLATLEGTGKDGRILKSDVAKAIKQQEGK